MQVYVADYLGDTQHLSAEEHGAYLLLLFAMWRADGRLPADPQKLCRIARVYPARWARVWATVGAFFTIDETGITQKRLSKELEKVRAISSVRSEAGKKGSMKQSSGGGYDTPNLDSALQGHAIPIDEPKPLETNDAVEAIASVLLKHSQIPDTREEKKGSAYVRSVPAHAPAPNLFEEFWKAYPKRLGANPKHPASLLFAAALKRGEEGAEIVAGARAFAAEVRSTPDAERNFVPMARTWLNQCRWKDYAAKAVPLGPRGPPEPWMRTTEEILKQIQEDRERANDSRNSQGDSEPGTPGVFHESRGVHGEDARGGDPHPARNGGVAAVGGILPAPSWPGAGDDEVGPHRRH